MKSFLQKITKKFQIATFNRHLPDKFIKPAFFIVDKKFICNFDQT